MCKRKLVIMYWRKQTQWVIELLIASFRRHRLRKAWRWMKRQKLPNKQNSVCGRYNYLALRFVIFFIIFYLIFITLSPQSHRIPIKINCVNSSTHSQRMAFQNRSLPIITRMNIQRRRFRPYTSFHHRGGILWMHVILVKVIRKYNQPSGNWWQPKWITFMPYKP